MNYIDELYFKVEKEGKNYFLTIGNKNTKNENIKIINKEVKEFKERNEYLENEKKFKIQRESIRIRRERIINEKKYNKKGKSKNKGINYVKKVDTSDLNEIYKNL